MTTTNRISVVTAEKNEVTATAEIKGWSLTFNYKSIGDEKPKEFSVTGSKRGTPQTVNYQHSPGINDMLQFFGGASLIEDFDLVQAIHEELVLITS